MAEAAGLAVGVVGLAGLFTSCIDLLDLFESGKDWVYDFSLALTKLRLMKIRLHQLKGTLPAEGPLESYALADSWEKGKRNLSAELSSIDSILGRTNNLCKRYSYKSIDEPIMTGAGHTSHMELATARGESQNRAVTPRPPASLVLFTLGRRLCWALRDKKRFESLIADFDFLLSNLERITKEVENTKPLKPSTYSEGRMTIPETVVRNNIKQYSCHILRRDTKPTMSSNTPQKRESMPARSGQMPTKPHTDTHQVPSLRPSQASTSLSSSSTMSQASQANRNENSNNKTMNHSIFITAQGDTDDARQKMAGVACWKNNECSEKSAAFLGPVGGDVIKEVAQLWQNVAIQAGQTPTNKKGKK